jgi:hypothetical protein
MPIIPVTWEVEVGGLQSKARPRQKFKTLPDKQTKSKRTGDMAQVVENFPSMRTLVPPKSCKPKKMPECTICSKSEHYYIHCSHIFKFCLCCVCELSS